MEEYKRCRTKSHDPEITIKILDILGKFHNRTGKSLKKEYVREFSIRHHKKLLRLTYKTSSKKYQALLDKTPSDFRRTLIDFATHAKENQSKLISISKTSSGPETDGKSKRNFQQKQTKKSFNDFFVRDYFSEPTVKESYILYMKFMFANPCPAELCENFKYSCCSSETHNEECLAKWSGLKDFFLFLMFRDLEDRFLFPYKREKIEENKSEISYLNFREANKPEVKDQSTQIEHGLFNPTSEASEEGRRILTSLDLINCFGQQLMNLNFAYIQLIADINK